MFMVNVSRGRCLRRRVRYNQDRMPTREGADYADEARFLEGPEYGEVTHESLAANIARKLTSLRNFLHSRDHPCPFPIAGAPQ